MQREIEIYLLGTGWVKKILVGLGLLAGALIFQLKIVVVSLRTFPSWETHGLLISVLTFMGLLLIFSIPSRQVTHLNLGSEGGGYTDGEEALPGWWIVPTSLMAIIATQVLFT